jgi:polyribonucleotide nucleotidyltransferase
VEHELRAELATEREKAERYRLVTLRQDAELAAERVNKTTDVVKEGDAVKVKVIGFDDRGKVKLSMRVVDQATGADITEQVGPKRGGRPEGEEGEEGERRPRRDGDRRPRRNDRD